jgi:hypothetical protein
MLKPTCSWLEVSRDGSKSMFFCRHYKNQSKGAEVACVSEQEKSFVAWKGFIIVPHYNVIVKSASSLSESTSYLE